MPQLKDAPSEKYTFGGAGVLTDGIHGDFNYSNGCWLGKPTRFSNTASSIFMRRMSNPVAERCGLPYTAL